MGELVFCFLKTEDAREMQWLNIHLHLDGQISSSLCQNILIKIMALPKAVVDRTGPELPDLLDRFGIQFSLVQFRIFLKYQTRLF